MNENFTERRCSEDKIKTTNMDKVAIVFVHWVV